MTKVSDKAAPAAPEQTPVKRGRGRPPGTRLDGPVARLRNELLGDAKIDKLVEAVYKRAVAGDAAAARMILDRVFPPLRTQAAPVNVALAGTLSEQAKQLISAASEGRLPPDVAAELVAAIGRVVAIEAGDELRARLEALEHGDLA
jgi:hypothetical protein